MSEYVNLFFSGTKMIFDNNSISIKRNKTLIANKELRITKAKMKKGVLQRSVERVSNIKVEALS